MPRINPVHYKTLVKVFEKAGFKFVRQEGSHIILEKPGFARPLVIPGHKEVQVSVILSLLRSAKMKREEYFGLLP
jgi:predicted RNA binding protein YcfA (HicA-like mRNA interferase family)